MAAWSAVAWVCSLRSSLIFLFIFFAMAIALAFIEAIRNLFIAPISAYCDAHISIRIHMHSAPRSFGLLLPCSQYDTLIDRLAVSSRPPHVAQLAPQAVPCPTVLHRDKRDIATFPAILTIIVKVDFNLSHGRKSLSLNASRKTCGTSAISGSTVLSTTFPSDVIGNSRTSSQTHLYVPSLISPSSI